MAAIIGLAMGPVGAQAATKGEIEASVKAAKARFVKQVKGANEYLKIAKGVLVMPNVTKAGFVVGAQYGNGALQVNGKTVSYYSLAGASLGFQAGAEKSDMIILFVTDEALKKFRASKGWEAGVDANVALVNMGGGERVDFTKMKDPIIGFVLDVKGLMADISLKGAKFTKFSPK
jgi:lipid-binding SYLF domain-containing protein